MSKDVAFSSSSISSQNRSESIAWSSTYPVEQGNQSSVMHTIEKSAVLRVRTLEKLPSGGGKRASNRSSTQTTQGELTEDIDDDGVHKTLVELYAETERKRLWLNNEEEAFRCGQQRLSNLQQEHAALLCSLEQCKRRRKERLRIQKMMRGPQIESGICRYNRDRSSGSDSDYSGRSSSSHPRRDGAKKERKRLRRFQSELSLRFQLLESECRGSDLKVDKLVAELRREYADSCLFGNSMNF